MPRQMNRLPVVCKLPGHTLFTNEIEMLRGLQAGLWLELLPTHLHATQ